MVAATKIRPPGDCEREEIERLTSMRRQLLSSVEGCESQMYTWEKRRDEYRSMLERNDTEVKRLKGVLEKIAANPNREKQYKIALISEELKKELALLEKSDRRKRLKKRDERR